MDTMKELMKRKRIIQSKNNKSEITKKERYSKIIKNKYRDFPPPSNYLTQNQRNILINGENFCT
jgi:hypothetical protein